MQTRSFGRTGHQTSVAILGAYALADATPAEAENALELALETGVNQIDVAPSSGRAEELLAPWLRRYRERFFLCCKTLERSFAGAQAELQHSLERMQVEQIDMYQLHAVTSLEELERATRQGGALEAIQAAQMTGVVQHIGITEHGFHAPAVFLEALNRYDFTAVLFPLNSLLYAQPDYRQNVDDLLCQCRDRQVGVMIIKSIARSPWVERQPVYHTGYQPFDDCQEMQKAVNFVLSQDITGLCTAGDLRLLPLVLQACKQFTPLSTTEQEELIAAAIRSPRFITHYLDGVFTPRLRVCL